MILKRLLRINKLKDVPPLPKGGVPTFRDGGFS